jgi:hypothetical protein
MQQRSKCVGVNAEAFWGEEREAGQSTPKIPLLWNLDLRVSTWAGQHENNDECVQQATQPPPDAQREMEWKGCGW